MDDGPMLRGDAMWLFTIAPSHRRIVHRIASSSFALDIIRKASVSLLGRHS